MLPSHLGYVRGWTKIYHLIAAPVSSAQPRLDPWVTDPALCGRAVPEGLGGHWGLVFGGVGEATRVCKVCVRRALQATRGATR